MKTKYVTFLFLFTGIFTAISCDQKTAPAEEEIPRPVPAPITPDVLNTKGSGFIKFTDYEPLSYKPVTLWYHSPKDNPSDLPILFVFHGTNRNGETYRDVWVQYSEQYQFLLITPEFDDDSFPGSASYNLGNIYDDVGALNPEEQWTFSMIEPIFDFVVAAVNSNQTSYDIYGHSAGSQFVHRFLTFKQNTRVNRAIAANAGWYTFTDFDIEYPYGLANSPAIQANVEELLQRPVVILLGEEDIQRSSNLRQNEQADRQGYHRLERGTNYFKRASELALEYQVDFNWTKERVPGVGHSNSGMAPAAAKSLYDN